MKMPAFLLLCCMLMKCGQVLAAEDPVRIEARSFQPISTREHSKLVGHVLEVLRAHSLLSCSHSCLARNRCCSTNFGAVTSTGEGICELNDACVAVMTDQRLVQAAGFVYTQYGDKINEESCGVTDCLSCVTVTSCLCGMETARGGCFKATRPLMAFHFTPLGAKGRRGPVSPAGYSGTSLEGKVHIQQGLQQWTVPVTGLYEIEACGASGGDYATLGGKGAKVTGSVHLQKGTQLTLLIGQAGIGGGGGGGSFVVFTSHSSPLVIAGGGGGGGGLKGNFSDGDPGQAGPHGSVSGGASGTGGLWCQTEPNKVPQYRSGAGGGHRTSGGCYKRFALCGNSTCIFGGTSFEHGGLGGQGHSSQMEGGFGGGGGNSYSAGGGGGYSGGGVLYEYSSNKVHAGGGGSFIPCPRWNVTSGGCEKGDGHVIMTFDISP